MAWYLTLATVEGDEELQKQGIVEVFYANGALDRRDLIVRHLTLGFAGLLAFPIRFAALHFCYDNPQMYKEVNSKLLLNMFSSGKTPLVELEKLSEWGYQLVIVPSDLQRAAIFGMNQALQAIKATGHTGALEAQMITFSEREDIVKTAEYLKMDSVF